MAFLISAMMALFMACGSCFGATFKGLRFPEQLSVGGKTLRLNGLGLMQKTLFNIDIYVAGLYLQRPAHEEREVLESDQVKKVVLVFLHDASAKQLSDAWEEGFKDSCADQCAEVQPQLARFQSLLTDVRRGQEVRFIFYPDRLAVESGPRKAVIPGKAFAEKFLATFIGRNASDSEVRDGLLARAT